MTTLMGPHAVTKDMYAAYKEMAADTIGESEALEWAEGTMGGFADTDSKGRVPFG